MKRSLDFSLLQDITSASILIRLSRDVDDQLRALPHMEEFYHRAQATLMFLLRGKSGDEAWRSEAYIRAGLNEFYSLEDAGRRGFRRSKQLVQLPKLCESRHPLIHIMYSLRHINVHVKPSKTEVKDVTVTWNDPNNTKEFTYGTVMLADETARDLLESVEVKKFYHPAEIQSALTWLFENQQAFGVGQVFRDGTEAYCREVLAVLA